MPQPLRQKTDKTLLLFEQNPFDPKLRNHSLEGDLRGLRSINITGDYRVFFLELSEGQYELVEFLKIGTHSQLYG